MDNSSIVATASARTTNCVLGFNVHFTDCGDQFEDAATGWEDLGGGRFLDYELTNLARFLTWSLCLAWIAVLVDAVASSWSGEAYSRWLCWSIVGFYVISLCHYLHQCGNITEANIKYTIASFITTINGAVATFAAGGPLLPFAAAYAVAAVLLIYCMCLYLRSQRNLDKTLMILMVTASMLSPGYRWVVAPL